MNKAKLVFLIAFLFIYPSASFASDAVRVAAGVAPVGFILKEIGGNRIDVSTMVPPDSNPHFYDPSMRRMISFSKSSLFFSTGGEFEEVWLKRLLSLNNKMKVVELGKVLPVSSSFGDPHIWMSPSNVEKMAENVMVELISLLPSGESFFRKKYELFVNKLNSVKKEITETTKECHTNKFVTIHPVLGYFASEFHLEQIAVEESGQDPSARHLSFVLSTVKKENIDFIFSEPQVSQKYAHVIAEETGAEVEMINPLKDNLFVMFDNILSVFKKYCR